MPPTELTMTTNRSKSSQNKAGAGTLAELRRAVSETEDALAQLRKACGLPARRRSPADRDQPLQRKRVEAGQLMTKLGYRIDHDNQKSGLVRIVGPNFSEDFFDIADFDGTADNAVSHYASNYR